MGNEIARRRTSSRAQVPGTTVVNGASLGGLAGCVLGAAAGFVAAVLAMDDPSGLQALMPLVYGLYSAAIGILVGGFVGYWLAIKVQGSRANPVSLGLLAGFMILGGLVGVALGGAPPPVDIDPGWPGSLYEKFGPWAVLALIIFPGPAAFMAHRLGERLRS